MRCKRIIASCLIIAIMAFCFTGCDKAGNLQNKNIKSVTTSSDKSWEQVVGDAILENNRIRFVLDTETTHFTITDKVSNRVISSVAPEGIQSASEDIAAKMSSELSIVYYSEQSDAYYMYSQTDSVNIDNYKILTDGKSIRVYYTLGEKDNLVPEVFDEKSFDELLDRFEDDMIVRRFKRYYSYYSFEDYSEDMDDVLKKYPFIKKKAAYVADENLTEIDMADISEYLESVGYTKADYDNMINKLGVTTEKVNKNPGYTIPMEYTLTDNGFTVKVLTDKIIERTDEYKLQSIEILPFFDSSLEEGGSYFVADGSGAVFDYNSGQNESVFECYGEDYSLRTEELKSLSKNTVMPVFGSTVKNGGFFADIIEGEEVAKITVSPQSISSPLNNIYSSFVMRSIDVNDYSDMDIPIYNLFQKELTNTIPTVEYSLLTAESNQYWDMAELYREKLELRGELNFEKKEKVPVYVDYLCMITEADSMMGIPYTKKVVLSTITEITNSVQKMIDADVGPVVVRLIGYSDAGYEHKVYSDFNLSKKVGTKKELIALQKLLEENGGMLYMDTDMAFSYKNGNGFSSSDDTARYLNRLQNLRSSYDIVTHKYDADLGKRYFISPRCYSEIFNSLTNSMTKELGKGDIPGFSYGTTGMYLGADYNKNYQIDRVESRNFVDDILKKAQDEGISMMFDGGNAYVLQYADHLLNIATTSSNTDAEKASVPFVQMVLHSYMNYAGTPYNIADNSSKNFFETIGYGSSIYGTFITRSDELITKSNYKSVWHSLSDKERLDDFIQKAIIVKTVQEEVLNSKIVGYSRFGNISVTEYENGYRVYVNYGAKDETVNGETIKAGNFLVKGR